MKLEIELVPKSSWYSNLRKLLTEQEWEQCKKFSKIKSKNVCEICGGVGTKWKTECHEEWKYDDKNNIQYLSDIVALCPDCHLVKHIGYAQVSGKYKYAFEHLKKINGLNNKEANDYVDVVFLLWANRSKKVWQLNLDYLISLKKDIVLSEKTLKSISSFVTEK